MKGIILLLLWKISSFLARCLPLGLSYGVATIAANFTYVFWARGRRHAKSAMRRVLGRTADAKAIEQAARRSLQNYSKNIVDFLRFPSAEPEEIERSVQIDGWEKLDAALKEGKGVILVGLHFGSWDMAGAAIALKRYPLNVVIEEMSNDMVNHVAQTVRHRWGIKTVPMDSAIQLVRALKRNEILALLIDQPNATSGVYVELFGDIAKIPRGAAVLALRTGAKVIPGAVVRLSNNRYQGLIDSQIDFKPSGDLARDIADLTRSILASLEGMVRLYPDQWYVFRSLWSEG